MRQVFFIWAMLITSLHLYAQDCDIPLRVIVPWQVEELPTASKAYFVNKLRQIVVNNGIVGSSECTPFAITAKFDIIDKHVVPGPPSKIVQTLSISLFIIDTHEEKIFSSTSIDVKAVGNNETKAYMDAIKQISPSNKEVQGFVQVGKNKMLDYYDRNFNVIIKKAQTLASLKKYEEALYHVTSIPECSKGYDVSVKIALSIFQAYENQLCTENLAKAKMAWVSDQSTAGANKAGQFLSCIYPDAACYEEAMQLYKEIKEKIVSDWKFEMKQYSDAVSLESQRISAVKAIGTAYGNGQKPTTTSLIWMK